MTNSDVFVSISEAARRLEISRHVIERWIEDGKLAAGRSGANQRVRLVRYADVEALLQQEARPDKSRTPDQPLSEDPIEQVYLVLIDQTLTLIYSNLHRLAHSLYPAMFQSLTIEQLRSGPLGQDLRQLARIASGAEIQHRETVLALIEDLLQLFFWPAASDDYSVPRSFWDTEFGRMLALVKFRSFQAKDLMTIGDAAHRLGVTRPVVYRWMDDRTLGYVRDDATGHTFVVARDVENIVAVARAMTRED